MKTLLIFLSFIVGFCHATHSADLTLPLDWNDPDLIGEILATDPDEISPDLFYECKDAIIAGYSGTGGFALGESEIQWLRKAEESFKKRNIKIKGHWDRHFIFGCSYLNWHKYEKALQEFKLINYQDGIERAEWFINNAGITSGYVKIHEYPGRISYTASENDRAGNKHYLFVAYFRGGIYRYDRQKDTHAIIYIPQDSYNWCEDLKFDGRYLTIKRRNDPTFIFDNVDETIRICKQK
ncbi:hypothetical protein ES706_02483 [subsurface metagenome]